MEFIDEAFLPARAKTFRVMYSSVYGRIFDVNAKSADKLREGIFSSTTIPTFHCTRDLIRSLVPENERTTFSNFRSSWPIRVIYYLFAESGYDWLASVRFGNEVYTIVDLLHEMFICDELLHRAQGIDISYLPLKGSYILGVCGFVDVVSMFRFINSDTIEVYGALLTACMLETGVLSAETAVFPRTNLIASKVIFDDRAYMQMYFENLIYGKVTLKQLNLCASRENSLLWAWNMLNYAQTFSNDKFGRFMFAKTLRVFALMQLVPKDFGLKNTVGAELKAMAEKENFRVKKITLFPDMMNVYTRFLQVNSLPPDFLADVLAFEREDPKLHIGIGFPCT